MFVINIKERDLNRNMFDIVVSEFSER